MLPSGYLQSVVRALSGKLGWKRAIVLPLEETLLDYLGTVLPPEIGESVKSQLKEVNLVQRIHTRRTECNYYKIEWGKADLDRERLLDVGPGDVKLATIRFETESGLRQVVEVHVVNGVLFSLNFGGRMEKHLNSRVGQILKCSTSQGADG